MPVVGPKSAEALQAYLDHPEPPLAEPEWIEKQIAVLRVKPSRAMSQVDAEMLLKTFVQVLREYPRVDLGYAFGRLMRESKWFPDVSEIVEKAKYPASVRAARKHEAWKLLHKHKAEWVEPIPDDQLCDPDAIEAIKAEVAAEFDGKANDDAA